MRIPICLVLGGFLVACASTPPNSTDSGTGTDGGSATDSGTTADSGVDAGTDAGPQFGGDAGPPPLGQPIPAAADGGWQWVDFPDSTCNDGTPTGVGVSFSGTSSNLLIYMMGGGACWDYLTCYFARTTVTGPYGQTQFNAQAAAVSGSVFDRTIAANPFKDWNYVFVPYCTGDIHGGDNVMDYGNGTPLWYHKGHANILAYLKRLGATFPAPAKVVVSGSSAGGGGTLANYATARWYWPTVEMYLLDDSLPLFEGNDIPQTERQAWYASWNLAPLLVPVCGTNCINDLSLAHRLLAQTFPRDRMALLSYNQDAVISTYYGQISGSTFEGYLNSLTTDVLAPSHWGSFYLCGNSHTMLGDPGACAVGSGGGCPTTANNCTTSGGVQLWSWLTQMVTDDPSWASAGP